MKSARRVVHITTVHHPFDTRIYHKECKSLQRAGYNVTLIAPADDEERVRENEIEVIPITKRRSKLLRMFLSTLQAFRVAHSLKADYYHIHDPELLPVAWLLKRKHNVVIYDIHEDYVTSIMQKEYIVKPVRRVIALIYKIVETVLTRNIELCLAEKYYKNLYPKGQCILNYPILNDTLKNRQIDERPVENELIYTGNVSVERGAFIHATLPLLDDEVSVSFVGKCPQKLADQMFKLAGDRRNCLTIEGIDRYVPREEIDFKYISKRWLAGLALFPPSEHYKRKELTKFFEYMSAGIPILCSDFPVWKSFVEKHGCGIAVNPCDKAAIKSALDYLKTNPNKAAKMGKNGQHAVKKYLNWNEEEEKLIQWYDELWDGMTVVNA